MTALTMLSAGCHHDDIVDNFPTFVVSGTVSTAVGAPVPASTVQATIRAAPQTCGDSGAFITAATTTNSAGQYEVVLFSPLSSFTGCLRVRADTTQVDTMLVAVPPHARVQVNVRLP
jgi:hypothetical protein